MSRKFDFEWTLERGLESYDILVNYEVHSWGCSAQTYGPPENCYPAEPMEMDIIGAVMLAPTWAKGKYPYDLMPFALTDREREVLEKHIYENPPEDDYDGDYRDYDQ